MERKNINYKTENELIQLIKSIQRKKKEGVWDETLK